MEGNLHLSLAAGIILSFLQAPFLHIHDGDGGQRHAHGFAHAHWLTGDGSDASVASEDDIGEARKLTWMPGDGNPPIRIAAAPPDELTLPEPFAEAALVTDFIPCSHDPPWRPGLRSRAPPA